MAESITVYNQAKIDELLAGLTGAFIQVVDAGADLNTARPADAVAVLWRFDTGVDVGTDGANVTNGQVGDLYFVASS